MSVLIKGMKMPKNCEECDVKAVCKNYWKLVREQYTRPWWCPLVELSSHGKLKDVDALEVDDGWLDNQDGTQTHIQFVYANGIINTPTIIEAEEVYDIHTDTAGNLHWIGTQSGEHTIRLGVKE